MNMAGLTSVHRPTVTGTMTGSTSVDYSETTTSANMAGLTGGHYPTVSTTSPMTVTMTGNITGTTTGNRTMTGSPSADCSEAITFVNMAGVTSVHRPTVTGTMTGSTSADCPEAITFANMAGLTWSHCPTASTASPMTGNMTGNITGTTTGTRTMTGSPSADCSEAITFVNMAGVTSVHRPTVTGTMTGSTSADCPEAITFANMAGLTWSHCPTASTASPMTGNMTGNITGTTTGNRTMTGSPSADCSEVITFANTAGLTSAHRPTVTGTMTARIPASPAQVRVAVSAVTEAFSITETAATNAADQYRNKKHKRIETRGRVRGGSHEVPPKADHNWKATDGRPTDWIETGTHNADQNPSREAVTIEAYPDDLGGETNAAPTGSAVYEAETWGEGP